MKHFVTHMLSKGLTLMKFPQLPSVLYDPLSSTALCPLYGSLPPLQPTALLPFLRLSTPAQPIITLWISSAI
jgi:hypothetical protein